MIVSILLGCVCGFALSIPPGPLSATVARYSVTYGFRSGLMIGLGGAIMDIIYMLVAAFASSALVVTLVDLIAGGGWVLLGFQVVCTVALLIMGIRYMMHKENPDETTKIRRVQEIQEEKAGKLGHSSPFFVGVLIAIANLASPAFIPSVVSVVSYFQANGLLNHSAGSNIAYALGFGAGTACWFTLVAKILVKYRLEFTSTVLSSIYKFAGGTFILGACVLTYHIIVSTDWGMLR